MSIQLKRSLTKDIDANYILEQGQPGIEMLASASNSPATASRIKIGDGQTKWSELPYSTPAMDKLSRGCIVIGNKGRGASLDSCDYLGGNIDDSDMFDEALSAAGSRGGVVYIMPGYYPITRTLVVPAAVTSIIGLGQVYLYTSSYKTFTFTDSSIISIPGISMSEWDTPNRFENISIDAASLSESALDYHNGIYFNYSSYYTRAIIIRNCTIRAKNIGYANFVGIRLNSYSLRSFVENNHIFNCGIGIQGSGSVSIKNNVIDRCSEGIALSRPTYISSESYGLPYNQTNIVDSNIIFTSPATNSSFTYERGITGNYYCNITNNDIRCTDTSTEGARGISISQVTSSERPQENSVVISNNSIRWQNNVTTTTKKIAAIYTSTGTYGLVSNNYCPNGVLSLGTTLTSYNNVTE